MLELLHRRTASLGDDVVSEKDTKHQKRKNEFQGGFDKEAANRKLQVLNEEIKKLENQIMSFDENAISDEDLAKEEEEMKKEKEHLIGEDLYKFLVSVVGTGVIFVLIMFTNMAIATMLGAGDEEEE